MAALCMRDLWFDDRNGGMPQGALHKSLGHEQQPGHALLEQGPGRMLWGVIPCSLLSNLASAVLILQWLDFLRNLHGYNRSKPWYWHACFTIKVYTGAVSSPLSERCARQKRPLKQFLPLCWKPFGFRHVNTISLEVFGLPGPGWSSEVNPYPPEPRSSIAWFSWELDALGRALDCGSAPHAASLEIRCAGDCSAQAPQQLCWSDPASSQTCQAAGHGLALGTWGISLCWQWEGAEGTTYLSLPGWLAGSGSPLHKNGASSPGAELLWSQSLACYCVGADKSPKAWAEFS